jgi:multidrug efflux pump subunit AcrA (membrane-fusion protein)
MATISAIWYRCDRKPNGFQMSYFRAYRRSRTIPAAIAAVSLLALATPTLAADEEAPKGEMVTVIKAAKSCFANIVEVSGFILAQDEKQVRPERMGLKVADVLAEAGDSVTAGQTLARLNLPEGGSIVVQAPVAGVISEANATIGAFASAKGEALFTIITDGKYDMVGLVPVSDIAKLAVKQPAAVRVIGSGDVEGTVRRIGPTVQPAVQQGQVFIGINTNRRLLVNAAGRALIKTGQSCNIAVPLTAVQYGSAGTVVQVVKRDRVETRRVEVGLMSGGQIEVRDGLNEGDDVVARAGALLREGDPVRPVAEAANVK